MMLFVYLDEFGHIGPFVSRTSKTYNESPVFGLAGIILPESCIRLFGSRFLHLKEHLFGAEIIKSKKISATWEKKGVSIFRPKAVANYPRLRDGGFRLLSIIQECGGEIFYSGREKFVGETEGNSVGLYKTILAQAIRELDDLAVARQTNFAIVIDEHSARKELLECAAKTMFGTDHPARKLVSPPFEAESYLNQHIQAADWVATIVGRLWAHESSPDQFADHKGFRDYYWERLHKAVTHNSNLLRRRKPRAVRQAAPFGSALAEALEKALHSR